MQEGICGPGIIPPWGVKAGTSIGQKQIYEIKDGRQLGVLKFMRKSHRQRERAERLRQRNAPKRVGRCRTAPDQELRLVEWSQRDDHRAQLFGHWAVMPNQNLPRIGQKCMPCS